MGENQRVRILIQYRVIRLERRFVSVTKERAKLWFLHVVFAFRLIVVTIASHKLFIFPG